MEDKNRELMRKMIEAKNQKSAQQGLPVRHEKKLGGQRTGIKRHKKGGLFDK